MQAKTAVATFLAGLAALLLFGGIALAAPPVVGVRTGDHPGYGRVVFDLPAGTAAIPQEQNGRLIVHFDPAATARAGAALPRNVRGITAVGGGVEIAFLPGAQTRITHVDGKLVVDVLDAASGGAASAPKPAAPVVMPAASAPRPPPTVVAAAKAPLLRTTLPLDRHDDDAAPPSATAAQPATPAAVAASAEPQLQPGESLVLLPEAVPSPADPSTPLTVGNIVTGAVLSLAATPRPAAPGKAGHGVGTAVRSRRGRRRLPPRRLGDRGVRRAPADRHVGTARGFRFRNGRRSAASGGHDPSLPAAGFRRTAAGACGPWLDGHRGGAPRRWRVAPASYPARARRRIGAPPGRRCRAGRFDARS